jgi:hypothetical protein
MNILNTPLRLLAVHSAITLIFTLLIFLPAVVDFGNAAIANSEMELWQIPFTGILESITIIQIASYLFAGIFSFALAYRFSKSFLPSMTASFAYNFSILHFEGAVFDLSYLLAFVFVPLFFVSYFSMSRKPKEMALFSGSLLLVALGDLGLAGLCGFIVFVDMFMKKRGFLLIVLAFLALLFSALQTPERAVDVEMLGIFMPSDFMLMSLITGGIAGAIYLGLGVMSLVASSIIIKGANKDERYFLGWFLFSLFLFLLTILAGIFAPFGHLSTGFVLMALVFLGPLTALFFERIFKGEKYGAVVLALLAVGSIIERWPIVGDYLLKLFS